MREAESRGYTGPNTAHRAVATPDGATLRPIQHHKLALVRPILRRFRETCRLGILTQILPDGGEFLVAPDQMIEKSFLPQAFARARPGRFAETLLEQSDPAAEVEGRAARHEEMNVVRHDDVPTDSDAMFVPPALEKGEERCVEVRLRQPRFSLMGAKGDEINRGVTMGIKHRR